MALTEESKSSGSDREAGTQIESPVHEKMAEVPSRAARGKVPQGAGSLGRPAQRYQAPPIALVSGLLGREVYPVWAGNKGGNAVESRPLGGIFIFKSMEEVCQRVLMY